MFSVRSVLLVGCCFVLVMAASGQSRRNIRITESGGAILSVTASRVTGDEPIRSKNLYLYENGIEQKVKNFSFDPSPARIVILVDNSQTVRTEIEKMRKAVMEFAYEIFDGDQLFVVAYDEKAEIIEEWTDDAKKLEKSLSTLRKKGNPYLFDALSSSVNQILLPLMPGTRKTAIVVIGDGLDRGSTMPFENALGELQNADITVYSLQLPDRTGGAYRRNQPKAKEVLNQLVEGTGGRIFPFEEAQAAAKSICDELRKNRYLLSYTPIDASNYDAKRVFIVADEGITIRTKNAQPPNVSQ